MLKTFTLEEVAWHLQRKKFPISGVTPLGSTEFHILEPAPYLGLALHNGSRVRPALEEVMSVSPEDRFREEDPYTDMLIKGFPIRLIARDSRFEYDLNWEQEKCIYSWEEKKWGLEVWNRALTESEIRYTHDKYSEFHGLLDLCVEFILKVFGSAVLFDVHSFCYQRDQRMKWFESEKADVNLGTRSLNRDFFAPQIEAFLNGISTLELEGHKLKVVENELFPGGYLTRKFADSHFTTVLVLAVEYKKIYMDEWSGRLYPHLLEAMESNLLLTKEKVLRRKV